MIRGLVFLITIFCSSYIQASPSPWGKFTTEFKSLMESLTELGDDAEKGYTFGQLTKLHRDLLRIERSKEDLVFILKNPEIYQENLEETLTEARDSTESSRKRLESIRDRVALLSESASKLEQILSDSLRSRKSWLTQVDLTNPSNGDYLIDDGDQAIETLKAARSELEEFLRKSKKSNTSIQEGTDSDSD